MIWRRLDDEANWPPMRKHVVVIGGTAEKPEMCVAERRPFKAGGWRWRTAGVDADADWNFLPHEMWAEIEFPAPFPTPDPTPNENTTDA